MTPFAFRGEANGVVLRNLVVTHYATQSQFGAIHAEGPDWTIEEVTSRDNHATGIFFVGDRSVVRDSRSIDNGQPGIGGTEWPTAGSNGSRSPVTTPSGSTTSGRAAASSSPGPPRPSSPTPRCTTTTGRDLVRRERAGLDDHRQPVDRQQRRRHLLGDQRRWHDHRQRGDRQRFGEAAKDWVWGAGIQVAASRDVTISDNRVSGNFQAVILIQQDRDSGPMGEHLLDDMTVTGNTIDPGAGHIGAATDIPGSDMYERNLRFTDNTYEVDPAAQSSPGTTPISTGPAGKPWACPEQPPPDRYHHSE